MQILIEIDEKLYNDFVMQATALGESLYNESPSGKAKYAIANGTPLPKGHGRLIDINDIEWAKRKEKRIYIRYDVVDWDEIVNAPTIIEADKEREE